MPRTTRKMDAFDKVFTGLGCFLLLVIVLMLGLFGWAVIELVHWITSK